MPAARIAESTAPVRRDLPPALSRGVAHSMQNFAVGEFSVSHEGQRRVTGEAHSSQNFARSGFSAPHLEQRIADPPKLGRQSRLSRFQRASQRLDSEHEGALSISLLGTFRPRSGGAV
jgi:hypothetical protein